MTKRKSEGDDRFEVASAKELRDKYGLVAENRPHFRLDRNRVPPALWSLIQDAELVGISDDLIREDVWRRLTEARRQAISRRVRSLARELDDWLAGPESYSRNPSPEYIAFSTLRITAD